MSFYDSAFIEIEVGNLISAAGLTPANIVFEITERLAIENFASFKRALAAYTAMGFGVAIDDVGTRHSNLETVMSLRPHFIKISDVLVRGIARSTVKREMLRSLRHIAETIDAVMIAEGIEHFEDVMALRDLGLRYGQGYYMARPGPPFPTLRDDVRAELRSVQPTASPPSSNNNDDEGEDDEDRVLAPTIGLPNRFKRAFGSGVANLPPPNAFGRADDEITSDFRLPPQPDRVRPRGTSKVGGEVTQPIPPWKPLTDEEFGDNEALIDSLRKPADPPAGERGPGRPGLN
jgi:hypothetical protein